MSKLQGCNKFFLSNADLLVVGQDEKRNEWTSSHLRCFIFAEKIEIIFCCIQKCIQMLTDNVTESANRVSSSLRMPSVYKFVYLIWTITFMHMSEFGKWQLIYGYFYTSVSCGILHN